MSSKNEKIFNQQTINAPFHIKSAGISMTIIVLVAMYAVANLMPMLSSDAAIPQGGLSLVITTVVGVILLEIVLQIVLFIGAGRIEKRTAVEELISLKASRNAHLVLTAGSFAIIASMFLGLSAFEMGSGLLVVFLLAEVVKFASQIIYFYQSNQTDEGEY